jgi:serine/threonine-protein kinase
MVTRDGDVKILDFGLAKLFADPGSPTELENQATQTSVTEAGVVVGTLTYMSPEQASGASLDARSDVFSLGVVLYEMVTGRRPFAGATRRELLAAVLRDEPPVPSRQNASVGPALERVILRCLRKKPEERFASAEEVLAALEGGDAPAPRRPVGPARMALVVGAGVIVAVAALSFGVRQSAHTLGSSTPAAPASIASAAPVPTAITDLPEPKTTNAEAAALYRSALQLLRDASIALGQTKLQRAVQLDPSFAAAHVQILLTYGSTDDEAARRSLAAATQSRSLLSERDAAILETRRPEIVASGAADPQATWNRWKALVDRFPGDAEIVAVSAVAAQAANRKQDADAAIDRAIALDPKFAYAYVVLANLRLDEDDLDAVLAAGTRCMQVSPSATSCVLKHFTVLARQGKCGELLADARQIVAVEPDSPSGYQALATALFSTWAPPEAVEGALRHQAERIVDPDQRAQTVLLADVAKPIMQADFGEVVARFTPEMQRLRAHPTAQWHLMWAQGGEVMFLDEMGDHARAADLADDYMRRTAGLMNTSWEVWTSSFLLGIQLRMHRISEAEYHASRDRIYKEAQKTEDPVAAWLDVYAVGAGVAHSADEAREALAAQPQGVRLPSLEGDIISAGYLGQTYLLAGRLDDAIPMLRRAVASCPYPDGAIWFRLWAAEPLGEALEQKGDKDGACAAYAEVLSRWGNAKPRSVTADAARAHAKKLGCGQR